MPVVPTGGAHYRGVYAPISKQTETIPENVPKCHLNLRFITWAPAPRGSCFFYIFCKGTWDEDPTQLSGAYGTPRGLSGPHGPAMLLDLRMGNPRTTHRYVSPSHPRNFRKPAHLVVPTILAGGAHKVVPTIFAGGAHRWCPLCWPKCAREWLTEVPTRVCPLTVLF